MVFLLLDSFAVRDFRAPIWCWDAPLKICAMQFNKNEQVFRVQPDRFPKWVPGKRCVRCHFTLHTDHFNRSASISFLFLVCLLVLVFFTFVTEWRVWDRSKYKKPKQNWKSYFTFSLKRSISSNATKRTLQYIQWLNGSDAQKSIHTSIYRHVGWLRSWLDT